MRLAARHQNRMFGLDCGAKAQTSISNTMSRAVQTRSFLRPIKSDTAPRGTSASMMVAAQMTLSRANCSMLSPKSKKMMAKTA